MCATDWAVISQDLQMIDIENQYSRPREVSK